jgi:hypothetical protein
MENLQVFLVKNLKNLNILRNNYILFWFSLIIQKNLVQDKLKKENVKMNNIIIF